MPVRPTPGPMAALQECAGLPPPGLPSPCLPLPLPLRIGLARRYPLNATRPPFSRPFQVPAKPSKTKEPLPSHRCAARRAAMSEAKDKKDYYEVVAHVLRSGNVPCQGAMQAGHAAFDCGRCGVRALLAAWRPACACACGARVRGGT